MALWLLNGPKRKGERPRRVKKSTQKKRTKRNPHLAVYANPPHKRHRKASSMARRRRSKTGRFVKGSTHRRRSPARRRRRNPPYQFAAANPRRRRRRAAVSHRRHGRRRYRRNPGLLGISFPPMKRVLFGVGGAAASSAVPQVIGKVFPSIPTGGPVGLAVRAAGSIVAGHLVGRFAGKEAGDDFALGGLIAVGNDAFHLYIAPSLGLGSYLAPSMRAYLAPGQNLIQARARNAGMSGVPTPNRFNSAARF